MTITTKANIFFWTVITIAALATVYYSYDLDSFYLEASDKGQLLTDTDAGYNPPALQLEPEEGLDGQNHQPQTQKLWERN